MGYWGKPHFKKVTVTKKKEDGKIKKFEIKLRKNKPKKCSTPRRVCIICKTAIIHKLSKNYADKVCKDCLGPPAPEPPVAVPIEYNRPALREKL